MIVKIYTLAVMNAERRYILCWKNRRRLACQLNMSQHFSETIGHRALRCTTLIGYYSYASRDAVPYRRDEC